MDATARILINGAVTDAINILKGSRQGDPLSMDKFMIAIHPLIVALNVNEMIKKFRSRTGKKILTLVKADDLTVLVQTLSSLLHVRHIVMRFQLCSGLEMNMEKTKGLFFNKTDVHKTENLPFNHWNENMIILGIPYGSEEFINSFRKQKILDLNKEVVYFRSFHYHTLQAKAIISKSKLIGAFTLERTTVESGLFVTQGGRKKAMNMPVDE